MKPVNRYKRVYSEGFIIPDITQLLGRKINVFYDTDQITAGTYGHTCLVKSDIHIATTVKGIPVPPEEMGITFLHEALHLIIAHNGHEKSLERAGIDLEKLVEDIATGMFQVLINSRKKIYRGTPVEKIKKN